MIKACELCGKEQRMTPKQRFCGGKNIVDSCSYKVCRKIKPPVNCVDCGIPMKRVNNSTPRCGKANDFDSCSGKHALSQRKRPSRRCAWCTLPLETNDIRRIYHGNQREVGSCAHQVQMSNMQKYNANKAKKVKVKPKISYASEGTKAAFDYWCC